METDCKIGKWAQQILALQQPDGSWGQFHSMSKTNGYALTTEQALTRLQRLGFTIQDDCIQKAVIYMEHCLKGELFIPDPREKLHDWDIFTSLMLAARIRLFAEECEAANATAQQWADILTAAFRTGEYNHEHYLAAYRAAFGQTPPKKAGRLVDFVHFYPIALLPGFLDAETEAAAVRHILQHEGGLYYIYEKPLHRLPETFASLQASRFLAAIELLARWPAAKEQLSFVKDWLLQNRDADGGWDMGAAAKDNLHFPYADSWRRAEVRRADCTRRIRRLLDTLA